MFEYAQKCLRVYSKYINDSELEDKLNDLLCMELEDFSGSVSESQLSVGTSCTSRAESEVTDDYNGFTSVASYPCHTDNPIPVYKREEEQSRVEMDGDRETEDEDGVSDGMDVHPRKLNTEEENYLSSLQLPVSGDNFSMLNPLTSAEPSTLEETVPSPVGMSTTKEDSPFSDTVASNDASHATHPPASSLSYSEPVSEEKTNDEQEEGVKSPHPPMGPSMYPPMMGPHPLMLPRLPPPYFMPYYYPPPPPYGFPPNPWHGYIHPMMFPPMQVVPVPPSPQQPQEDKNGVDPASDNEQSKPAEVLIAESSPPTTHDSPTSLATNDQRPVSDKEAEGLSTPPTDGSSTGLQDSTYKFQSSAPVTSLLPTSQSNDIFVHQPPPSPQQLTSQELLPQQPLLQKPPKHQLAQQNDHTKGPSSLHILPKDTTSSVHKTSYRHHRKARSTVVTVPSKKDHLVESEHTAIEDKANKVVKENPKRDTEKREKTMRGHFLC